MAGFNDKTNSLRGHFRLEVLDKNGNVIDQFEKHNLIMNNARKIFSQVIAGKSASSDSRALCINRFCMGTSGHVASDVFSPKGEVHGFVPSLNDLFSKSKVYFLPGSQEPDPLGGKGIGWDSIEFEPVFDNSTAEASPARIISDGSQNNSSVSIQHILDDEAPRVTYIFEIAQDAFNGKAGNNGMIFTECGLYVGEQLFAMRTFPGKIKEDSVSFRIIWTILF